MTNAAPTYSAQLADENDEVAIEAALAEGSYKSRCLSTLRLAEQIATSHTAGDALSSVPRCMHCQALSADVRRVERSLVGYSLAFSLASVVRANELLGWSSALSPFDCRGTEPAISLSEYVERFCVFTAIPLEVFAAAVAYVDRFVAVNSMGIALSRTNVHRLFAVAFVAASKWVTDFYYSNSYYAKVAGLRVEELNSLERVFLSGIQFSLVLTKDDFDAYTVPAGSLARAAAVHGDLCAFVCEHIRVLRARAVMCNGQPSTGSSTISEVNVPNRAIQTSVRTAMEVCK